MSNHHLQNKSLSLKAKGLLTLMLSLPDDWDYSVLGLTTLSKDGKDGVMSALDELGKSGYLTITRVKDEQGHFVDSSYDIYEFPQTEKPYAENPNTEKPYAEKPYAENPPQYNIEENKNKNNKILKEDNPPLCPPKGKQLDLSFVSAEYRKIFEDWLEYKASKNSRYKQKGAEMCYKKLIEYSNNNPYIARQIVEQSMASNYQGLFPLKNEQRANQTGQTDANGFHTNPYIEAGYDPRTLL